MIHDDRLFFKVAKHLGIDAKDLSSLSQIEVNKAYLMLLSEQIENKAMLVEHYTKQSLITEDADRLFMKDDLFKQRRELLDLCVEYAAKQSYMEHHKNIS